VEGRKKEVSEVCGVWCVVCALVGNGLEREKGKNAQRERENGICCFMGLGGMKRRDNVESFFIRKIFLLIYKKC
jgi:hypothetical protein